MEFLNKIALLGLITLPIVGCSKKETKPIIQKNETYELNLKKGFVYLIKNINGGMATLFRTLFM